MDNILGKTKTDLIIEPQVLIDWTSDVMVASFAHRALYYHTSFKKRIYMSAQQLFDEHLINFRETVFKNTLTIERLTSILEHMSKGCIAKYVLNDYVGYAFLDEHRKV